MTTLMMTRNIFSLDDNNYDNVRKHPAQNDDANDDNYVNERQLPAWHDNDDENVNDKKLLNDDNKDYDNDDKDYTEMSELNVTKEDDFFMTKQVAACCSGPTVQKKGSVQDHISQEALKAQKMI